MSIKIDENIILPVAMPKTVYRKKIIVTFLVDPQESIVKDNTACYYFFNSIQHKNCPIKIEEFYSTELPPEEKIKKWMVIGGKLRLYNKKEVSLKKTSLDKEEYKLEVNVSKIDIERLYGILAFIRYLNENTQLVYNVIELIDNGYNEWAALLLNETLAGSAHSFLSKMFNYNIYYKVSDIKKHSSLVDLQDYNISTNAMWVYVNYFSRKQKKEIKLTSRNSSCMRMDTRRLNDFMDLLQNRRIKVSDIFSKIIWDNINKPYQEFISSIDNLVY